MRLPRQESCNREEFIFERIRAKKVLHLGCADWPFTERKIAKGSLLHQRMRPFAAELVGVDLEPLAISMMRAAGMNDVHTVDSEKPLADHLKDKFDVVVAGEILEHVPNPGKLLDSIKSVCTPASRLLVTVPNFAPIKRLPRLLYGIEEVHPDHVFYFSYSTLGRLLRQCRWEPLEWKTYWRDVGSTSRAVNRVLERVHFLQYFADGFCVTCQPLGAA